MDATTEEYAGRRDPNEPRINISDTFSPDSYYAVSKVFGEALGKFYSVH
jgi:hypothetical protein